MSTSSIESSVLSALQSSYTTTETEETTSSGTTLGTEDFLTLLLAQLENQNPLDPTDTSDFTDQLAQYTQVEQLINLNDKMDVIIEDATDAASDVNVTDFVGMQVTGEVNTMTIEDGSVTSGFYTLTDSADIMVYVYDEDGNNVTTLDEGQVDTGSYLITWDGTDSLGEALDDGTYTYIVLADSGSGYEEVSSTLTGTVDSVVYLNGNAYLSISGVLMSPSSIISATEAESSTSDNSAASIMDYLGTTVSSYYPIVQVDDGVVSGDDLTYYLESASAVTITIYNASDEEVATIQVNEADTAAGDNSASWDALADSGYQVSDGLYYYTVETDSGSATTPVSGEVTGIYTVDGTQYLALGASGRLVSLSTVTSVQ